MAISAKNWVFANRTVDFMQGWHMILDAIKYAITEATKMLNAYIKQEEKEEQDLMIAVALADKKKGK